MLQLLSKPPQMLFYELAEQGKPILLQKCISCPLHHSNLCSLWSPLTFPLQCLILPLTYTPQIFILMSFLHSPSPPASPYFQPLFSTPFNLASFSPSKLSAWTKLYRSGSQLDSNEIFFPSCSCWLTWSWTTLLVEDFCLLTMFVWNELLHSSVVWVVCSWMDSLTAEAPFSRLLE